MNPSTPIQDQIRSGYARGARWHDAFVRAFSLGLEPRLRRRMVRRLDLRPGAAVLDLACGTGLNFEAVEAAIGPGGTLVGVDLSAAMLDEARKKVAAAGWANVTLLEADAAGLGRDPHLRVGPVDAALCTLAIGLMPDPGAVLRAMVAAVRPGGRVLISDARLADRWYGPLVNPLLRQMDSPWVPPAMRDRYWAGRPWEALLLAACGAPAGQAVVEDSGGVAAQGQALFSLNCGECHGEDGTGTDEAPAVLGHTAEEVVAQVRTPEGDMEAIAADKLSDADLELIAVFVAGLGGAEAHPEIEATEEERVHLEAAFEAIEDFENMDREAGITHLEQAAALASGEAAELYEELLEAVRDEKAGVARHELKELLGMAEGH